MMELVLSKNQPTNVIVPGSAAEAVGKHQFELQLVGKC